MSTAMAVIRAMTTGEDMLAPPRLQAERLSPEGKANAPTATAMPCHPKSHSPSP